MEQLATSVENSDQEKPRKRFTYHDNSLPDHPVIFETFAEGILQADGKFMKETGIDPMQQSNIGCVVEDVVDAELSMKKLEKSRLFVDTLADAEGHPVDAGIKETIAVLNAYDIPTTQSCEGHSDQKSGRPYPWVRVGIDGEPVERFVGQEAAFQQAALERGVPVEDLKRGDPEELFWELIKTVSENDETDEFKKWSSRNGEVLERVRTLLNEFYQGREIDEDVKLIIEEGVGGEFELRSNEAQNNEVIFGEISPEDFSQIVQKLHLRQVEMMEFTNFVRMKLLKKNGNSEG